MLIREQADSGKPTAIAEPESQIAMVYQELARQVGRGSCCRKRRRGDAEHHHQRRLIARNIRVGCPLPRWRKCLFEQA
jgi:hypothetical protein